MRSVRLMTCIKHISTAVCRRTMCIKYLKKKTLFFTNFFEILRHETLFYLFLLVLFTKSSYFKIKTHTINIFVLNTHTFRILFTFFVSLIYFVFCFKHSPYKSHMPSPYFLKSQITEDCLIV